MSGDNDSIYFIYNSPTKVSDYGSCGVDTTCQNNELLVGVSPCGTLGTSRNAQCFNIKDVQCPTINGISGTHDGTWADGLGPNNLAKNSNVRCTYTYPSQFFKNNVDIIAWTRQCKNSNCDDPVDDKDGYNRAMDHYCTQTEGNCIGGASVCSRYTANSIAGQYCRAWADAGYQGHGSQITSRQTAADQSYKNYCSINQANTDCTCINAATGKDSAFFSALKANGVPNYCWYTPCDDNTSTLNTYEDRTNKCPSESCNIINTFINDQKIDISNIKQSTTCTFTGDTACTTDTDCPTGSTCENQKCTPTTPPQSECKIDSDCLITGQACKNNTCISTTLPSSESCKLDSDCKTGSLCKDGTCEEPKSNMWMWWLGGGILFIILLIIFLLKS